jgi:hypothetical protein
MNSPNNRKIFMAEQIFFEQGKIKITSTRAIFDDHTYVLSAVTSVRYVELKPDRKWPMFLVIFGVFCVLTTTIIGAVWWFFQKTKHVLLLSSASGEICAMVTKDKILAERVVAAINEAIVSRG